MHSGNRHCDAWIVGAGPAGLAAAIALHQRGADVLIADAQEPPIDKACGEGLMPDSRSALAQLGIDLEPHHGAEFTGITFASDRARIAADFPSGRGIGVRRTTLHRLLCDRASALGVRFAWNTTVVLKEGKAPTLGGAPITFRWLIGADGHASRVRAWAGLDRAHLRSRRFGFRAHYRVGELFSESRHQHVEVHWGPLGQAYVTPIAADEICVSAMTRHAGVRLQEILGGIPALRERLRDAPVTTTERGSLTLTRRLRRVTGNNVALIGDASGSVDAITGEGLALGFQQALLLADSLAADSLACYESHHAAILTLPQRMATLLLLLDRLPMLRDRTLRAFAARPTLFHELLAVHLGEQSLPNFLLRHGPALGTLLLTLPEATQT
ncbi:MAG TPA: FAD-dependent monooxygenase [Acidobacteriaceae bacterium]|nr:FAD-dependent monooxygenase [Acidobacteriaceae bacterium]